MDINYIIAQLLDDNTVYETSETVTEMPKSDAFVNEVASEDHEKPKQKVSMLEYIQRKQELNKMMDDKDYRTTELETSSDESSSSSDESEPEPEPVINDDIADDVSDFDINLEVPRTKNELSNLPQVDPPAVVKVPEEHAIMHIGEVMAIVEELVVIKSKPLTGDNLALDIGSIIAFEDRNVLGEIFETFGPVDCPFYSIRFNHSSEIDHTRAFVGAPVFQSPAFSKVVFTALLKALKGSDASNIFDEELPEEDQEFSDDEAERESGLKKKAKRKRNNNDQKQKKVIEVPRGEYIVY